MDYSTTSVTQMTNDYASLRLFLTRPYSCSPLFSYLKLIAQIYPVAEQQSNLKQLNSTILKNEMKNGQKNTTQNIVTKHNITLPEIRTRTHKFSVSTPNLWSTNSVILVSSWYIVQYNKQFSQYNGKHKHARISVLNPLNTTRLLWRKK